MVTFLGGNAVAGGKLKEAGNAHWGSPNTGATNSSGFTALPGGYRDYTGPFYSVGTGALFWTSSIGSSTSATLRQVVHNNAGITQYTAQQTTGASVRCIRN
jgi:uncharacterized protein (TIGR02145 family)